MFENQLTTFSSSKMVSAFLEPESLSLPHLSAFDQTEISLKAISSLIRFSSVSPLMRTRSSLLIDPSRLPSVFQDYFEGNFMDPYSDVRRNFCYLEENFKYANLNHQEFFTKSLNDECFRFLNIDGYQRFDDEKRPETRLDTEEAFKYGKMLRTPILYRRNWMPAAYNLAKNAPAKKRRLG